MSYDTFLSKRTIAASRKSHVCDWCSHIEEGEAYVRYVAIYEGDFMVVKMHLDCDDHSEETYLPESESQCMEVWPHPRAGHCVECAPTCKELKPELDRIAQTCYPRDKKERRGL